MPIFNVAINGEHVDGIEGELHEAVKMFHSDAQLWHNVINCPSELQASHLPVSDFYTIILIDEETGTIYEEQEIKIEEQQKELTIMTTSATQATTTTTNTVALNSIDATIKTYQMREYGINEDHVEALTFSDRNEWQPFILKPLENGMYAIISGFHRYEALTRQITREANERYTTDNERANAIAHAMQNTMVKAEIVNGTSANDTMLIAYKYNSEHGLPLTIAEKKKYAVLLHLKNPSMPHYKIAMIAHISDKTVKSAIQEYEANLKSLQDEADEADEADGADEEQVEAVDYEKRFKAFANQLRKFYTEVITEVGDDAKVSTYLMNALTKQADTKSDKPYDGDFEVLKQYQNIITTTVKRMTPKPETTTKAKTPKTPKHEEQKQS